MKNVVFSHGFGVRYDDRGLFTDIQTAFPDARCHMFDYNKVHKDGNMTVRPLNDQAKMLEDELAKINGPVTLIGHSQGCAVAALADVSNVKDIIFLAPAHSLSQERTLKTFGSRPGSTVDIKGTSEFARRDGTTTYVPQEFWNLFDSVDLLDLYEKLGQQHALTIFRATEDEILGLSDFSQLASAEIVDVAANHDFTGSARDELIMGLGKVL